MNTQMTNQTGTAEDLLTFPASFAQQRIWFAEQFQPGCSAFSIPYLASLQGSLHVQALATSLQALIERHESLRTTFRLDGDQLLQDVHEQVAFALEVESIEQLPSAECERALQELIQARITAPFDLEKGPLFRALVVRQAENEHVLLLVLHHIVADGWSMGLLMNELAALYAAEKAGQSPQLPELALQYGDFSEAQREWLDQGHFDKQKAYWLEQLQGPLPELQLPGDHPKASTASGALYEFQLPPKLVQKAKERSRTAGTTLFMTLLAGWNALLYRYTGQTDMLIGTPVAGRNRHELEPLIGCFLNTLLLRTQLTGSMSFANLLDTVRQTCLGAYDNQDLPIEMILDELEPKPAHKGEPPFQVMFMLQNTPNSNLALDDVTVQMLPVETGGAKFDLTLSFIETEDGFHGTFEYKTERFEAATIERLSGHLLTLLTAVLNDSSQTLDTLPLLTADELAQLAAWNDTTHLAALDRCLHDLLDEQAARTPEQIALHHNGQTITYRALQERSNQLARYLQRQGVTNGARVGVCLERSFEQIIALLAIFKSGAAYVPLDISYPAQRLAYIFKDSGADVLLTQSKQQGLFPIEGNAQTLLIDQAATEIAQESTDNLSVEPSEASPASSERLAFILYTSGSTGTPKGVLSTHRGAMNRLSWMWGVYPFAENEMGCHKTTLNFIDSVWEIFGPLLRGIPAVIVPETLAKEPDALLDLIHQHAVSRLVVVPSFMKMLLTADQDHRVKLASIRYWLSSGEALTPELAKQVLEVAPRSTLLNLYGSTEVYDATCQEVTVDTKLGERIPLGRPTWNTKVHVLDPHFNAMPIGVPGEVFIEGSSLALGYHRLPEQTREMFIPHPFSDQPDRVLYRIGDIGRWLPDGTLDYLGRVNHLVKVRGFRVELGEVEAVLRRLPDVREVVVHTHEEADGTTALVAYLVMANGSQPTIATLRSTVGELLPDYMVPAYFEFLPALPQTPNGKVDRQALPAPTQQRTTRYTAPQTPTEELIAGLWQELLGIERIGLDDNFFELGGHSLSATKLMSRLYETFRIRLPLRKMFEDSTVRALAAFIEQKRNKGQQTELPPIQKRSQSGPAPLSFSQERLWFLQQMDKQSTAYNIMGAIRLRGPLDVSALEQAFAEIVRRHEVLRTTFQLLDGRPVQIVHDDVTLTVDRVTLPVLSEEEQEAEILRHAQEEAARPFDLEKDLMIRVRLLEVAEEHAVLLVNCHHIAADGWSLEVLSQELVDLYDATSQGNTSTLPELPLQVSDIATWQTETLQGQTLDELLAYWKKALGHNPPILQLPTDRPRPSVLTTTGAVYKFQLSSTLSDQLQELSRRSGATMFMTLLAAWNVLLARYSGQTDILVGTPVAGRNRSEVEQLIGCFVNTLVLRTDLGDDPSFANLLQQVRTTALDAYSHQDVPFDKLVNELQIERNLSYTPLFQVMFVLQNANEKDFHLHNVQMEGISLPQQAVKCDLHMALFTQDQNLEGSLEYNSDLFDERTIERMVASWNTLLEQIVADPEQPVSHYPLLSDSEATELIAKWSDTAVDYADQDALLHELFERQAAQTPDQTALVYEGTAWSYHELNARAEQLAIYLQQNGVKPGTMVGVYMQRSLEMVLSLYGILKAGGAYVPLDPNTPAERLAFLMEDTQVPVLLTQADLAKELPPQQAIVIALDSEWERIASTPTAPLQRLVQNSDPAYVIYTSGSTGRPKGAMVPHRGIVNRLLWMQSAYGLTTEDRVLQKTPYSFDVSVWEFFWPLLNGATLVIAKPGGHQDPQYLVRVIAEEKITTLHFVPTMLHYFLNESDSGACTSLKRVICSGEELTAALCERFFAQMPPHVELHNLYGPTEASVDVTYYQCLRDQPRVPVPIGRPVHNTQLYVLDTHLRPVPVGLPGELYIAGVQLAIGYHNRPDLTAERFIRDPFSADPQARMYKTGDLARYLPDGNIEYLGRTDFQIKLHGLRIELGEIETVLTQQAGVQQAVVTVQQDAKGVQRLVGFVVADDANLSVTGLLEDLRSQLPTHMVPNALQLMPEFPRTPSGKVDRRTLTATVVEHVELQEYVAPRNEIEQLLATAFSEVLGVAQVGIDDNFFALGGDSIRSIQILSVLKEKGVQLTVAQVFQYQTIRQLSPQLVIEQKPVQAAPAPRKAFDMLSAADLAKLKQKRK